MELVANVVVGVVAILHIYFLILEMFLWTTPKGLKTFGRTLEEAQSSKVLAANQGLYNGFLAAGLIWSLLLCQAPHANDVKLFFLGCVLVAGIYGGFTASRKIFVVQALPAFIGIILVLL